MGDPVTARKYRMMRLKAGDYICPSNDELTLWRFHQHIDGRVFGLECDYEERTFWRAIWMPMDVAREMGPALADSNPWEKPWHEADWYLPTRHAAIERMLKGAT